MNQLVNQIKQDHLHKILRKVNSWAPAMEKHSDEELRGLTVRFKERYRKGESLDALLPEAYAAVREAAKRVLGMYPYDVQVMGAIALHQGRIAEMKTGEGKTLVATMPLYLNALTGKSCILVTVNSYLAARDGKQMGELYRWMGLTTAIGVNENESRQDVANKKSIYAADIVYTTNSSLGFDYLLDNLGDSYEKKYMRPFYYVIIDEADAVLLDNAQTPLVISGSPKVQSNLYEVADYFVTTLTEGVEYETQEQKVWLTREGIHKAEIFFSIENLYQGDHFMLIRHIYLALKAHTMYERDKQYVVSNDQIILLDERNGRLIYNTKLRGGQHQAIEAKEHVTVTAEQRAMASITYQSFFNLFPKTAGMTGTGAVDEAELQESYGMDVVTIPTNHPTIRKDYPDEVFSNLQAQMLGAMEEVLRLHAKHQPVLLIANSIRMSDLFSEMLLQKGIPHNVLNAYNEAKEADIIKEAGAADAVTIATSMAGRGTDIKLTDEVRSLGGLAVIGIGRMETLREELQTRGRAGRQGDPGFSKFYVSLDDDVVVKNGPEWLDQYRKKDKKIRAGRIRKQITAAQKLSEDLGRQARRSTFEFAESITHQRALLYEMRDAILKENTTEQSYYMAIGKDVIDSFMNQTTDLPDRSAVRRFALDHISYQAPQIPRDLEFANRADVEEYLLGLVDEALKRQESRLPSERARANFYRLMTLRAIDEGWIEQVDYLEQLRHNIGGRSYAQRNIVYEYHKEAYRSFEKMEKKIKTEILRKILLGEIVKRKNGKTDVVIP